MYRIGLSVLCIVCSFPVLSAQRTNLLPAPSSEGKFRYRDSLNNWAILPQYDTISLFRPNGTAFAHRNAQWYLIDEMGDELVHSVHPSFKQGNSRYGYFRSSSLDLNLHWLILQGDSLGLLDSTFQEMGRYPKVDNRYQYWRSTSGIIRPEVKLDIQSQSDHWLVVQLSDLIILFDHQWQEYGYWDGAHITLDSADAYVSYHGRTFKITLGQQRPVERFHFIRHTHPEDDRFIEHAYTTAKPDALIPAVDGEGFKRVGYMSFLLSLSGDTVLSDFSIRHYDIHRSAFSITKLDIDSTLICSINLGSSPSHCTYYLSTQQAPVQHQYITDPSKDTVWTYSGSTLRQVLRDGARILNSYDLPGVQSSLGYLQFWPMPTPTSYAYTSDSLYHLHPADGPIAIAALLQVDLPAELTAGTAASYGYRYYRHLEQQRFGDYIPLNKIVGGFRYMNDTFCCECKTSRHSLREPESWDYAINFASDGGKLTHNSRVVKTQLTQSEIANSQLYQKYGTPIQYWLRMQPRAWITDVYTSGGSYIGSISLYANIEAAECLENKVVMLIGSPTGVEVYSWQGKHLASHAEAYLHYSIPYLTPSPAFSYTGWERGLPRDVDFPTGWRYLHHPTRPGAYFLCH